MSEKILSIVIPVFNKWNFTKSCLKDLTQLPDDHEIIIIDNASTDETLKEMTEIERSLQYKNICYLRNQENTFHSKACNQGFRIARAQNVLFLNNDIRIKDNHADWTKPIIDACQSTGGLVGPTMGLLDKDYNFVKEENAQLQGNSYLGGWCLAASTKTLEKLLIDEGQVWNEKFPFYFNDVDLSFRARQKHIPLTVISIPEAVHFKKVSAAQINIPKLYKEGRQTFLKTWSK